MALSDKIYLVGMPGAGKSTFGVELSNALSFPFIDLDKAIETSERQSISQIFKERGEAYFRQIESQHLKKLSQTNEAFVMSTGGGSPCFYNGMEVMLQHGVVIYLELTIERLKQRLEKTDLAVRPKFEKGGDVFQQLEDLLTVREMVYKKANIIAQESQLDSSKIIEKIKGIS